MVYDEGLAERLRDLLPQATEKKMFGGIAWMERGHLVAGVLGDDLIVRCAVEETAALLNEPGTKPFGMGGKSGGKGMRGWVLVEPEYVDDEADLERWIERSRKFARALPPK